MLFMRTEYAVADRKFVAVFRKSGKVGRKLHEYTVLLNAAHNSGHGLPDRGFCPLPPTFRGAHGVKV